MALVMVHTLELLPTNVYYIRQEETAINMQNRTIWKFQVAHIVNVI